MAKSELSGHHWCWRGSRWQCVRSGSRNRRWQCRSARHGSIVRIPFGHGPGESLT
ncbi:MAG: hypothetical protein BYD32DRAFT_402351 [Podila humilis]|nr:MAG: hypothetical protein BYD32DRAFT_402351 [Podila humilis]